MKSAKSVRIVCAVIAGVIAAIIIAGNIVLNSTAYILNQFFGGDNTNYGDAGAVLEDGDKVVQALGDESVVLLKNEDDFLPLAEDAQVNLFGWAATDQGFIVVGGGSGGTVIASENKVTLTQAFKEEGLDYNTAVLNTFSSLSSKDADQNSGNPDSILALTNPADEDWYYDEGVVDSAHDFSNTVVVVFSRFSGENASQQELIDVGGYNGGTYLELTDAEKAMLNVLEDEQFDVIVLFNTTNNMEMGFLDDYSCIKAALQIGVLGQSGALAVPRILQGKVNPSGRLADTLAYDYQTFNPSYINGRYVNNSMVYQEGIYVGYKWYETADAEGYFEDNGTTYEEVVQFPFGYGLSYTRFVWEITDVSWNESSDEMNAEDTYTVTVKVTNDGGMAGKDVVQLYSTPPYYEGGIEKAAMNLIAFAKTDTIEPGDSDTVTLSFRAYDLASYDDSDTGLWTAEEGDYVIKVMKDSHNAAEMTGRSNEIGMYSPGIDWTEDPDTNAPIANRFTGDTAYADMPIDGSKAIAGGVEYLSRASAFENMPTRAAGTGNPNTGTYRYDGYNTDEIAAEVAGYEYGADNGLYLVMVDTGEPVEGAEPVVDEDGEETIETVKRPATLAELSGGSDSLVFNTELMETLAEDYDAPEWKQLLDQLTQQEIKDLIGKGGFKTEAIESVGKPLCTDRDGPAGFNKGVSNPDTETKWTGFPTESTIGCSWNTQLLYEMGVAQGKVAQETGLQGWYAPGVNLHRSVYNTRNYEYFSEDSVLTGDLAAQIVKGAKENHLYCYVKHFAVSEAGMNPNDKNTWLTEQALREVYLKPFETCVKEGGANGMMSAFNRVGGVWAGSNHALLTDVLRGEWGFNGTVITDWQQGYMHYERGVLAGNDLWLAGTGNSPASLDLSNPEIAYAARRSAHNILYTYVVTMTSASEIKVTETPTSPAFVAIWVVFDVVFVAGLAVCVVFIVKPQWGVKKSLRDTQRKA